MEREVFIKIHSTDKERGPVYVTAGNREGVETYIINRDVKVKVPYAVADILRNTIQVIEYNDINSNVRRDSDPTEKSFETISRFPLEIFDDEPVRVEQVQDEKVQPEQVEKIGAPSSTSYTADAKVEG